jgi:precorrin-6B methylase 1
MGAGIFYGIGHPLNRSVRLRQRWSASGVSSVSSAAAQTGEAVGDPNLAELGAVYLALLFHPPDQPLTLCTDSLFVLQQMQWLTAQQVRA